jgi:plastocyanin
MWSLLRRGRPSRTTGTVGALTAVLTVVSGAVALAGPVAQARPAAESRAAGAVTVAGFAFTPSRLSVPLGGRVVWTFPEVMNHTTTSDAGFWDSGPRSGGATYGHTFATAGRYRYHCRIHASMHGKVVAPMTATGSASQGWHLRWASAMPAGFTVDVQVRRPGSTAWASLHQATTRVGASFHPAKPGSYGLRARSHHRGHTSGWTPTVTVTVS